MSPVYMYIGKTAACDLFRAGVAQLAEHVLGKDGVTGSIPVSSFDGIEPKRGAAGSLSRRISQNYLASPA